MHTASLHSYFYEWTDAMTHANALAYFERKKYRVERRAGHTLFRFEVVATDIDIITRERSAA